MGTSSAAETIEVEEIPLKKSSASMLNGFHSDRQHTHHNPLDTEAKQAKQKLSDVVAKKTIRCGLLILTWCVLHGRPVLTCLQGLVGPGVLQQTN
jgi:hypothetical protein